MPGRTFDMIFLSGLTGFFLLVGSVVFSAALLGGAFDQSLSTSLEDSSDTDISARRISPR